MKAKLLRFTNSIYFICLIFAIIYSLISIVPHFNYQTNAWDLGIFNQTLWQYSRLQIAPNTIRHVPTLFADHFELTLFLLSPFYWIFGSYTLLIAQIGAVIVGGIGIYKYAYLVSDNIKFSKLALVTFYSFYGIFTALAFDYHHSVVGIMSLAWILYFFKKKQFKPFYLLVIFLILSRENFAILASVLGLSILIFEKRELKMHGLITFLLGVTSTVLILNYIVPYFSGSNYHYWDFYPTLGNSPLQAIQNILHNPFETLSLIVSDQKKLFSLFLILGAGGITALFSPQIGILMIPILLQKFLSTEEYYWGSGFHTSVELAPIIVLTLVCSLNKLKPDIKNKAFALALLLNVVITLNTSLYDGSKMTRIFSRNYYNYQYRNSINLATKLIPLEAPLSAMNTLVPHLSSRDKVYLFPDNKDAEYILVDTNSSKIWAMKNKEELNFEITKLTLSGEFQTIYSHDGVILFTKRAVTDL